jgi:hypothetical protein
MHRSAAFTPPQQRKSMDIEKNLTSVLPTMKRRKRRAPISVAVAGSLSEATNSIAA